MNRDMTIEMFMKATKDVGTPGDKTTQTIAKDITNTRKLCARVLDTHRLSSHGDFIFAYNEVQRLRKYC
jgi:hypothetical protein